MIYFQLAYSCVIVYMQSIGLVKAVGAHRRLNQSKSARTRVVRWRMFVQFVFQQLNP
jgi:hypothetical protein